MKNEDSDPAGGVERSVKRREGERVLIALDVEAKSVQRLVR